MIAEIYQDKYKHLFSSLSFKLDIFGVWDKEVTSASLFLHSSLTTEKKKHNFHVNPLKTVKGTSGASFFIRWINMFPSSFTSEFIQLVSISISRSKATT